MPKWVFEPGHTAAEFRARHMMVTDVRGAFKNVQGTLDFDPKNPRLSAVQVIIDATGIWTGEPQRDAHLRSADFLDVENHPQITFNGNQVELSGEHDYIVTGSLAIRGVTRPVSLRVSYLGQWQTPWWEPGGRKVGRPRTEVARGFFGDNGNQSS
jgi:polyisoprenoid-binding protein YceI